MTAGNLLRIFTTLCLGSLGVAAFGQTSHATAPSSSKAAPSAQAVINYGKLPLSFEPNLGQTSGNVQWLARGPEYTLFLAGDDAVLEMNKIVPPKRGATDLKDMKPSISSSAVRMSLLGARNPEQTGGEDLQSGKANYFTGNDPAKWQHNVPMYGKVRMKGVYPGVDLVYYGHRGELEYDFVVAPGADASAIKLRFDGSKAALAANGDLVLPVSGGPELRFDKPVVYQIKNGARQPVEGSFAIVDGKQGQQVSFQLGAYDHSRELVIDPTFVFVGVLGTGNNETQANGMAVDASGEIILTGSTSDVDFPVTSGAYQTTCNQDSAVAAAHNYVRCGGEAEGYLGSAFITKISADGTSLVYSTYLHGFSGSDQGQAVAIDTAGDAIVLGQTGSNDFPITADAIESLCMPYYQMKGVVGGDPSDFYPIAPSCDGYFAGGGTEWVSGGPTLFIAKLDPTGATLLYSTFFGGTFATYPNGLALDSSDNIYFTSFMQGSEQYLSSGVPVDNWYPQSSTVPFPVTASAFQGANLAQQVTTLSELSADGHTLLYSTLLGATGTAGQNFGFIQPLAFAVGPNGIAYVGGYTSSDDVPTTAGSVRPACVPQSAYNGGTESGLCEGDTAWLAAFDTTQSGQDSLKYATYIGGPEIQGGPINQVLGLAADSANNAYVTGFTTSGSYPTTPGAYSSTCTNFRAAYGCNDTAFLTKINPSGSAYVWSTYFSGNQYSSGYGDVIGFDAKGRVYLYGWDQNYTYDLPFLNPLEPRPGNGSSYAFVATFSPDSSKLIFATPVGNQSPSAGNVYTINNGMALDADGNIYFAAYGADSGTWNASTATPGAYATTALGGWNRTYFGKISPVRDPTATVFTISTATAETHQSVVFTATVTPTTQTTPTPTGTVILTNTAANPATTLGTITLGANGTGTLTTSSLAAGALSITASYSGNATYEVSTSSPQALTINAPNPQSITFTPITGTQYAATTIGLSATASSGLTVSFASATPAVCSVSGTTASLLTPGTCVIHATQAGNTFYLAAPLVSQDFTVTKAPQTISFPAITATQYAASTLPLSATASSGLPVSLATTTPAVCTLSGTTASLLVQGTCIIQATQTGNATYAAAPMVQQNIVVHLAAQTITFPAPTATQYALTEVTLTATASSGLPITYSSISPSICTVSGSTASLLAPGICYIHAAQAGNTVYSVAPLVTQSFLVHDALQTITFPAITGTQYVLSSVPLSATASSGLTVAFASATTSVCTVSGATASLIATGTCVIHATQAGSSLYASAALVSQSFVVHVNPQTITWPAITATQYAASTLPLTATASSGLTVAFNSTTPSVCTVAGTTASLLTSGTCILQATQAGNADYSAAPQVQQNVVVHLAAQTITFPTIASQVAGANVTLSATASSGLAVSFTSATTSVCTVTGTTATMVTAGTCVIHATQTGNTTYSAAPLVSQSFAVKAN